MGGLMNKDRYMQRNMKYVLGLAATLLLAACSQDVMEPEAGVPDTQKGLKQIVITLPTENPATRADESPTHDEDELHGTVNVDKGVILIFSGSEKSEKSDFTFEKCIDVDFKEKTFEGALSFHGGSDTDVTRMTATAAFKPEENKYYMIYAFAYNSKGVTPAFDLGSDSQPKRLQKDDDEDVDDGDALASISIARPDNYADGEATMEVYGGWIYEFSDKPYPESGAQITNPPLNRSETAEILNYGGSLSRRTGRLEITLTDVPSTVTKATLIVDEYQPKIPVGMEHYTNIVEPVYFRNPFQPEKKEVETITPTDGTLHFCADMFPTDLSKAFIKIEDSSNGTKEYQIRVKDKMDDLNFIGVSVYISKNNRISIFPNFWLELSTEYKNLLQGNWEIDFGWGENYNSNVQLIPSSSSNTD